MLRAVSSSRASSESRNSLQIQILVGGSSFGFGARGATKPTELPAESSEGGGGEGEHSTRTASST
jgi:hypothetical protein